MTSLFTLDLIAQHLVSGGEHSERQGEEKREGGYCNHIAFSKLSLGVTCYFHPVVLVMTITRSHPRVKERSVDIS